MKPYKDNVSLHAILRDGWSRDFKITQTVREANEMGFDVTPEYVRSYWDGLDNEMDEFFAEQRKESHEEYCQALWHELIEQY